LAEAAANGHLTAAHDLSDGGLAQALVEACLRRNLGAHVALPPDGQSAFVHLFSESTARVLVSVRKGQEAAFAALAAQRDVPYNALGIVAGTSWSRRTVRDQPDELLKAHTQRCPPSGSTPATGGSAFQRVTRWTSRLNMSNESAMTDSASARHVRTG
jgi:phosphoribosylformylglycinamidine synthase